MNKLTEEDIALWNLYKSNYKSISKKVDNFQSKLNVEDKKLIKFSKNNFILEKKIIKALEKKQVKIDSTLDLHGLTQIEAKKQVKEFIINSFKTKKRNLIIITGKGNNNKGILKNKTPEWLNSLEISQLIIGFTLMPKTSGGEGAIFVKVKNKSKYL